MMFFFTYDKTKFTHDFKLRDPPSVYTMYCIWYYLMLSIFTDHVILYLVESFMLCKARQPIQHLLWILNYKVKKMITLCDSK